MTSKHSIKQEPTILTLKIIKENGRWFLNEHNGFTKEQNELVSQVPEMIHTLIGTQVQAATLEVALASLPGSTLLCLEQTDVAGGVTYRMDTPDGPIIGWLCSVFWYYFKKAPEQLFIRIHPV